MDKIEEYGVEGFSVSPSHKREDGSFFIGSGQAYHFKVRSGSSSKEYTWWLPESYHTKNTTFKFKDYAYMIDVKVEGNIPDFGDGAVYGITDNSNGSNFRPFVNNDARYYKNLKIQSKPHYVNHTYKYDNWEWKYDGLANVIVQIEGHSILVKSGPIFSYHNGGTIKTTGHKCDITFDSGFPYEDDCKVGVSFNGQKYYGRYITLKSLLPATKYYFSFFVEKNDTVYSSYGIGFTTQQIKAFSTITPSTQRAVVTLRPGNNVNVTSDEYLVYEDVHLKKNGHTIYPRIISTQQFEFEGLEPGQEYYFECQPYFIRESTETRFKLEALEVMFSTSTPEWDNGEAQALTTTKARLLYSTNLENVADTYVEWRRVDAPAVVQSSKATCPVVDGRLVGILNNLNPDVYYQFRPVYEHQSSKVYGSWVGIFTGDANVWFDPEVVTQPARIRENGSVTLRGSVLPGSGDISEQGFEIWPSEEPSSAGIRANRQAEATHRFVTCDGISMSVDISDLAAGTSYIYRTYAKVNGTIHTGQEERFDIPGTGSVDGITVDEETPEVTGYFNLQGVRSERPFPGLNIVVYSDGKTEKRVFKE